jgi:hypothetical protein
MLNGSMVTADARGEYGRECKQAEMKDANAYVLHSLVAHGTSKVRLIVAFTSSEITTFRRPKVAKTNICLKRRIEEAKKEALVI